MKMRKNIMLPHKYDIFDSCFGYDYEKHLWIWDVKYYLIEKNWCGDDKGNFIIGEISDKQEKTIEKLMPVVKQREDENEAFLKHITCKKRSCVCKTCKKICNCKDCVEKISVCNNAGQIKEK